MTVLNIAHRGASTVAPPNTLAAFQAADDLGADGIEFDVHLSADGVPVVIHDFTVDATTGGTGRVRDLSLAEIKRLDAGTSFDVRFAGQPIPTLEEVLAAFGGKLLLNVEIKSASLTDGRLERAVIDLVRRYQQSDGVIISSFNPFALRRIKHLAPDLPVGLNYSPHVPIHWLSGLVTHEARHPFHTMVDDQSLTRAHRQGYVVNPWTVDDPAEMQRLIRLGVDGIITNVPGVLRAVLETTDP